MARLKVGKVHRFQRKRHKQELPLQIQIPVPRDPGKSAVKHVEVATHCLIEPPNRSDSFHRQLPTAATQRARSYDDN